MIVRLLYMIIIIAGVFQSTLLAQAAPAVDENIPYLITFGGNSSTSWGDDDFCQVFFCVVPLSQKDPIYLRIYDPDTGMDHDEMKGHPNSVITFTVYGGKGCWSDTAAQSIYSNRNNISGIVLGSRTFGNEPEFNKKWYSLGPFNPAEGEYAEKLGGRVFKIVALGKSGDDGNIYKYFLSSSPRENIPIEGGNLFTYKYHFRLPDDQNQVCQIYPYIDDETISVEISNFDWDNDGMIRIYSVAKNGAQCPVSGEDQWVVRRFPIVAEEKNSTLEIQFLKDQKTLIRNNNVVIAIRNQYGISLPFYVVPIGGIPVYSPKIRMR